MTVFDLVNLCCDDSMLNVRLDDISGGECSILWEGYADEIPHEYKGLEVLSFDPITSIVLVLNVEVERYE